MIINSYIITIVIDNNDILNISGGVIIDIINIIYMYI